MGVKDQWRLSTAGERNLSILVVSGAQNRDGSSSQALMVGFVNEFALSVE